MCSRIDQERASIVGVPDLRRDPQPRLPWLWLRPRVLARLVVGFVVLGVVGVGMAVLLALTTPGWAPDGGSVLDLGGGAAETGLSPQAEAVDPDEGGIDAQVAVTVAEQRTPWLVGTAQFVAGAAKLWIVAPIVVVIGGVVWLRTGSTTAFWVPALAGAGGLALSVAVKLVVFRPRPPEDIAVVDAFGPSFPSGHVIRAVAVYGALAWLASAWLRRRSHHVTLAGATAGLVAAVGAARVYEGAHWLTDVLASGVLGAGWLAVVLGASGLLRRQEGPA